MSDRIYTIVDQGHSSPLNAFVVELVDTPVLGTGASRRAGSSPVKGTMLLW